MFLRSMVDCVIPMDDLLLCCIDIDCGAICLSFLVEDDVDLMYDGRSSEVGEGAETFRLSEFEDRSEMAFFPVTKYLIQISYIMVYEGNECKNKNVLGNKK